MHPGEAPISLLLFPTRSLSAVAQPWGAAATPPSGTAEGKVHSPGAGTARASCGSLHLNLPNHAVPVPSPHLALLPVPEQPRVLPGHGPRSPLTPTSASGGRLSCLLPRSATGFAQ